jgi:hypothetical protein
MSSHALLTSPPQVLDLSSTDGSKLVKPDTQGIFLDEFRVAIVHDESSIAELAVFNTLIPQDHPGNLQLLGLPPEYRDRTVKICVDHGRNLGTPNRDETLLADPAQAVLAMKLEGGWEPPVLLVVRTRALIEQMYLVRADSCVPWDEWGRGAVAIAIPTYGVEWSTFIHGAQVMVVRTSFTGNLGWPVQHWCHLHTFDFGRHSSLPLLGGADGIERRAQFKDGANFRFELGNGMPWGGFRSLSDGSLFYLVSCLPQSVGSEIVG